MKIYLEMIINLKKLSKINVPINNFHYFYNNYKNLLKHNKILKIKKKIMYNNLYKNQINN